MFIRSLILLVVFCAQANAFEAKFEIDKSLNLDDLYKADQPAIKISKKKGVYYSDASAVLKVDFEALVRLSLDYDHYKEMGMPNVQASRVVEQASEDQLYTWTQMSTSGVTSKHYLQVRVSRGMTPSGAVGIQWEQAPKKASWPYPEKSAFSRFDGSWYLEPLADGAIYVRYFVAADINSAMPGFLIDGIVKRQFRDGVSELIQLLARRASAKP